MNNGIIGKALVILIDNSPNSINGDFYPNRLEAQKVAIERLSTYLFSICSYTQIALITMSPEEFGIRSSFTMASSKINSVLRNIYSSSHFTNNRISYEDEKRTNMENSLDNNFYPTLLQKALKTALVMIDHFHYSNNIDDADQTSINNDTSVGSLPHIEKHILAFICSHHDIDSLQNMEDIKKLALNKEVIINIVAFGPDVNEKELLRKLIEPDNVISSPSSVSLSNINLNKTNDSNTDLSNLSQPNFISNKLNAFNSNSPNSMNSNSLINSKNLSKKKIVVNSSIKKIKNESHNSVKSTNNANTMNNNSVLSSYGEFIDIPFGTNEILSDIVLSSRIGTGNVKPQIPARALLKTNPDLFDAVYDMLMSYKRQAGNNIDPNVEHQIQLLDNCLSSTLKTPQRVNIKIQKTVNKANTGSNTSSTNKNDESSENSNNNITNKDCNKENKTEEENSKTESNIDNSTVFDQNQ